MSEVDAPRHVEIDGVEYELRPGPIRQSLSDEAPMLWGFALRVFNGGEELGVKTVFVGRVSVQTANPEALQGGMQDLAPVLYDLGIAKAVEQLEAGETGDEILFT
ncbi:MAG: hypothetical protein OER93_03190 [Thermoleophilia bacterium]|nr:hypothetical protein [Thermoleophilia bacterium]